MNIDAYSETWLVVVKKAGDIIDAARSRLEQNEQSMSESQIPARAHRRLPRDCWDGHAGTHRQGDSAGSESPRSQRDLRGMDNG
jgi:hypothetical protein